MELWGKRGEGQVGNECLDYPSDLCHTVKVLLLLLCGLQTSCLTLSIARWIGIVCLIYINLNNVIQMQAYNTVSYTHLTLPTIYSV